MRPWHAASIVCMTMVVLAVVLSSSGIPSGRENVLVPQATVPGVGSGRRVIIPVGRPDTIVPAFREGSTRTAPGSPSLRGHETLRVLVPPPYPRPGPAPGPGWPNWPDSQSIVPDYELALEQAVERECETATRAWNAVHDDYVKAQKTYDDILALIEKETGYCEDQELRWYVDKLDDVVRRIERGFWTEVDPATGKVKNLKDNVGTSDPYRKLWGLGTTYGDIVDAACKMLGELVADPRFAAFSWPPVSEMCQLIQKAVTDPAGLSEDEVDRLGELAGLLEDIAHDHSGPYGSQAHNETWTRQEPDDELEEVGCRLHGCKSILFCLENKRTEAAWALLLAYAKLAGPKKKMELVCPQRAKGLDMPPLIDAELRDPTLPDRPMKGQTLRELFLQQSGQPMPTAR